MKAKLQGWAAVMDIGQSAVDAVRAVVPDVEAFGAEFGGCGQRRAAEDSCSKCGSEQQMATWLP